jgi:hypothetical protein
MRAVMGSEVVEEALANGDDVEQGVSAKSFSALMYALLLAQHDITALHAINH